MKGLKGDWEIKIFEQKRKIFSSKGRKEHVKEEMEEFLENKW